VGRGAGISRTKRGGTVEIPLELTDTYKYSISDSGCILAWQANCCCHSESDFFEYRVSRAGGPFYLCRRLARVPAVAGESSVITLQEISTRCPVIPVLALDKLEQAIPLAQALCAGGLNVLEITLRTAVGLDAIRAIARAVPEAVVGVGTVLFAEQLVQAQDAGAVFAVSPGFTPELGKAAACFGMPYLPGVFTPSDIMSAVYYGYEVLKLYPADLAGGAALLKTLAGPFP
jgi:2-dehydro-3-deoxyphosphogluconate aldolase/(4S)-4-hydroxy-2-oxoglutarate aldolase